MYDNIGSKIKTLALIAAIVESVIAVIVGIALSFSEEGMLLLGFLLIFIIPFIAFVFSWLIYGFGELIEKVSYIAQRLRDGEQKFENTPEDNDKRNLQIKKLQEQGLITEEEYQQAISKEK